MEEQEERAPEADLEPTEGELEDLDVPEEDAEDVRGGLSARKAGGTTPEY